MQNSARHRNRFCHFLPALPLLEDPWPVLQCSRRSTKNRRTEIRRRER